jgi:hypothetical protein
MRVERLHSLYCAIFGDEIPAVFGHDYDWFDESVPFGQAQRAGQSLFRLLVDLLPVDAMGKHRSEISRDQLERDEKVIRSTASRKASG